jgi:pilus assembly protein CpaE
MKHVSSLTGEEVVPSDAVRLPFITLHAFCESAEAQDQFALAVQDRRMARVQAQVHSGGVSAAVKLYENSPTPNLVILESRAAGPELLEQLDHLAGVCDAGTKVMIVGYANDISLYRTLLQKGVSDYLVGPVPALGLIERVGSLYTDTSSGKLGRSIAFIGAKGGVGSSTLAQNVSACIARQTEVNVLLADLDIPFGSASINLDIEDHQGVAEAIQDTARLDEMLLERLMAPYETNLKVLTAGTALDRAYDFDSSAFDRLFDVAQASLPYVVFDVPHLWNGWTRKLLLSADEVVVVAAPDLINLRNAKHLVEILRRSRPNDGHPRLLLNQVGMPKRKEIKPKEFAEAVGVEAITSVPFDPAAFSAGAINGKMLADIAGKSPAAKACADVAQVLIGRMATGAKRKSGLAGLFQRKAK